MKVYLVGGAVRDELLGLPVSERDWVVVGADVAAMRAQGFVAADKTFPVFLHPESGEEYALARREVKRGEGYRGFEIDAGPDVTLEEDLLRRDLTINAMARDEAGSIIDPHDGRADLDARVLRHVSPAFIEDPLRLVRVARFAAKLGDHGFHLAHATYRLMRQMVAQGEMAHVTPERLWREMSRAMQTEQPWRFFEVLHRCGALQVLIPALAGAMGEVAPHHEVADNRPMAALKRVSVSGPDAARRLAATFCSCVDAGPAAERLLAALRADRATAQLLKRVVAARPLCARVEEGDLEALLELARLWRGLDAHADIDAEVAVCEAQSAQSDLASYLRIALPAARAVSAANLRSMGLQGEELGRRLAAARRQAMAAALNAAGLPVQAG